MNKNSGMLGLTATSNDMREIEAEALRGSPQHRLALDIYCHAVKKYIGAYMAELGKVDAIVFTGGIGENSNYVRGKSLENMDRFGIQIDPRKNKKNSRDISIGKVKILVIPTNEELAIARDTQQVLQSVEKEVKTQIKEAPVSEEFAVLNEREKVELVLLWAKNPRASMGHLAQKLSEKMGKHFHLDIIKQELDTLGLRKKVSGQSQKTKKDQ
jgi:acetate kinase